MSGAAQVRDIVCCSLEPWDEVWRRNQFLASEILRQRPEARILFVELPTDVPWTLLHGSRPRISALRAIGPTGRLWGIAPRKWLPRQVWPNGDSSLACQVERSVRRLHFANPVLWINDNTYADLSARTEWPSVYDVTDDWLLAEHSSREMRRQQRNDALMMEIAHEVVVCSPSLVASRGQRRPVNLIPNGVDIDHLRRPQPRAADLPGGQIVLYQGSISDMRLDVDLSMKICTAIAGRGRFVFIGPNSLTGSSKRKLVGAGALFLGPKPYEQLPSYLQHADVLVVPHALNPFTESLDPVKAREFVAIGRPTLATPVAGFRELGSPIRLSKRDTFVQDLILMLTTNEPPPGPGPLGSIPTSWTERAVEFLRVLDSVTR